MSKQVEALKLALEALEECRRDPRLKYEHSYYDKAITTIREALAHAPDVREQPRGEATLAQQESEAVRSAWMAGYTEGEREAIEKAQQQQSAERGKPVAYAVYHRMGGSKSLHWPEQHSEDGDHNEYRLVPLYTSPQPRQWVGLTKKEVYDLYESDYAVFYQRIEAKLREKNA